MFSISYAESMEELQYAEERDQRITNQNRDSLTLMSRYKLRFINDLPTLGSLNLVEPGELGIFCEEDKLYCKIFGKDKIEITVDENTTKTTQKG